MHFTLLFPFLSHALIRQWEWTIATNRFSKMPICRSNDTFHANHKKEESLRTMTVTFLILHNSKCCALTFICSFLYHAYVGQGYAFSFHENPECGWYYKQWQLSHVAVRQDVNIVVMVNIHLYHRKHEMMLDFMHAAQHYTSIHVWSV